MTARPWAGGVLALVLAAAGCGARASLLAGQTSETGTGGATGIGTSTATGGGTTTAPLGVCKPGDAPVRLVSGEQSPGAIAVDADAVYYVTEQPAGCTSQPRVKSVGKTGGLPVVIAHAENPLLTLAVDAQAVYWSDNPVSPCTTPDDQGYTIFSAPKGGGSPPSPFQPNGQFAPALGIVLDASFVYWAVQKGGALYRAGKSGESATTLYPGSIYALGIAADDAEVYWTSDLGVMRAPKFEIAAPVVVVPLAAGDGNEGIAVEGGDIYFTGSTPCNGSPCWGVGLVKRVPFGVGPVTTISISQDQQPHQLAVGPTSVYWAALDLAPGAHTGAVLRAPRSGGPAAVIAKGQQPTGIAVDESCVYWTDALDGSVWRAPL